MSVRRSARTTKGVPPPRFAPDNHQPPHPRPVTGDIREGEPRAGHNLKMADRHPNDEDIYFSDNEQEKLCESFSRGTTVEDDIPDAASKQKLIGSSQVQIFAQQIDGIEPSRSSQPHVDFHLSSDQNVSDGQHLSRQFAQFGEIMRMQQELESQRRTFVASELALLERERDLVARERAVIEHERRMLDEARARPILPTSSSSPEKPLTSILDLGPLSLNSNINKIEEELACGSHQPIVPPTHGHHEHRRLHDLPEFSGRPAEWPMFINAYEATTEAYGYSDLENLMRLQKCLTGDARLTVEHVIIHPRHVAQVMNTLKTVFGRPELLIRSQIQAARLLKNIDESHLEQLAPFAISVQNLAVVLDSTTTQNYLADPTLLDELVGKLPMSRRLEWAGVASRIDRYPNIRDFSNWLNDVARLINFITLPTAINQNQPSTGKTQAPAKKQVLLIDVHETDGRNSEPTSCGLCELKVQHEIIECDNFHALDIDQRWQCITRRQLCFCCLKHGHILPSCPDRKQCPKTDCSLWHHELLHTTKNPEGKAKRRRAEKRETETVDPGGKTTTPTILNCRETPNQVYFRIVPVVLYGPERKISTYALLDEGSSVTLVDSSLSDYLQLNGPLSNLDIKWFGSHSTVEKSRTVSLEISGTNDGAQKYKMTVRTVQDLALPTQAVESTSLKSAHPHLRDVPFPEFKHAIPKILIGLDHHHLTYPLRVEADSEQCGIVATQTKLGWVIQGNDDQLATTKSPPIVLHIDSQKDDDLYNMVKEFYTTEQFGVKHTTVIPESDENKRARSLLASTSRRVGTRFETGLLWKTDNIRLPESYGLALSRLRGVENKMRRDPEYAKRYNEEIASYVQKGYARKLTAEEARHRDNRTWYLPHFSVKNPNKPEKFRLVFDAAAISNNTSLNSTLLTGPDDNVPLTRILFQFRIGVVGVCADIREMFHQVRIRKEDQNAQRFLWRDGNDSGQPDVYVMEVMTFGSTCSPASAQFIKNLNAAELHTEFPKAVDAIWNKHYVDDFVCSFDSTQEAINVTRNVVEIHREGGFDLRGFVSNDHEVLQNLNPTANTTDNIKLEPNSTTEKILGMRWNTSDDIFFFETHFPRVNPDIVAGIQRPTKRNLLSVVMSVFDPFGLLSDFMLTAKALIQDVWRSGDGWDEPIPHNFDDRWQAWRAEIPRTQLCRVPRCYSPHITTASNLQLHIFADASEAAFAAVAYWRIECENNVELAFVCGKSRCAPLKLLSIPRLELQAAVLASRLLNEIKDCHQLHINSIVMWSDSQTVLHWIRSDQRKYKPFVAFRVAEIAEAVPPSCWRWCPTAMNVADDATRIQNTPKFDPDSRWLKGPNWLLEDETEWPIEIRSQLQDEDQEEVRQHSVCIIVRSSSWIDFNRFSSFNRSRRTLAWVMRFISNTRAHTQGRDKSTGELTASEVNAATRVASRIAQMEAFAADYDTLLRGQRVEKGELFLLNPYLDKTNVIRMYGRTDSANNTYLSHDAKHPIILPRAHRFTELLVQHYHEQMGHQLTDATIASVRSMYWIPQLRVLVRSVKRNCGVCKIRHAEPTVQMLGQLPIDRLTPYERPFTRTGLDYFGPVEVTIGRRREKRWVALFTCMAVRAVHLEIASDLSTDACLVCIRNLCNLRGVPAYIRCDNGTNFVGARNELSRTDEFLDVDAIQCELSVRGIQWQMNCPGNPEAGGAWERLVQSVKRVLAVTLHEIAPRVETLRALLLEAANMLNSRPLTHLPADPDEADPITPNHFLIGGANTAMVPAPENSEPMYTRKQWKVCKELAKRFWQQWIRDYLPELTRRSKHYPETKQLKEGDVVIICDNNQPRYQWKKGLVVSTFAGPDGVVRTAQVKTENGTLRRPATKLAIIDTSDNC